MSEEQNIEHRRLFTVKQVILIVAFAMSATFTFTMIYAEFKLLQKNQDVLELRIEYVNDRVSRKTSTNGTGEK